MDGWAVLGIAGEQLQVDALCIDTVGDQRPVRSESVAIDLDQPLVADPEVMRDLVEHDVLDLAA